MKQITLYELLGGPYDGGFVAVEGGAPPDELNQQELDDVATLHPEDECEFSWDGRYKRPVTVDVAAQFDHNYHFRGDHYIYAGATK